MAVPSAVLKQREKLERDLGLTSETPPLDPALSLVPPVTPPAPTPPVVTPPPVASDVETANRRIAELENLLKTRDGQASAAMRDANQARTQLETVQSQVAALEEAVAEVTKQKDTAEALATAKKAEATIPSLDDVPDLTEKEIEVFGQDSVGFVKKLSKRELLSYIRPLVDKIAALEKALARLPELDKLPLLERTVQAAQADVDRSREEDFFRKEILTHFNDFESVREAPEWKAYLTTDIPGKGIKVGHLLQQYRLQHNAPMIRSVIQGYYDKLGNKPKLSDLAVPPKTQTEGTPVTKPKMKASDYRDNLKAFTQKRLAKDKWDAFKTEFDTALKENRVEMDARL